MKDDYKEAVDAIWGLKHGDVRGLESTIKFLKADRYSFRSGYLKEYAWRYLRRVPLNEPQRERIYQIALKYLDRKMTREFWLMCRMIAQISTDEFREQLEQLSTSSKDADFKQRAYFLSAYVESYDRGEKERRRFNRAVRYGERWSPSVDAA